MVGMAGQIVFDECVCVCILRGQNGVDTHTSEERREKNEKSNQSKKG